MAAYEGGEFVRTGEVFQKDVFDGGTCEGKDDVALEPLCDIVLPDFNEII